MTAAVVAKLAWLPSLQRPSNRTEGLPLPRALGHGLASEVTELAATLYVSGCATSCSRAAPRLSQGFLIAVLRSRSMSMGQLMRRS